MVVSPAICGTAVVAVALVVSISMSARAQAVEGPPAINGSYRAVSNGEWATTNDRYHDEAVVHGTWTINSTCSSPTECTGSVTSDAGWSNEIYTTNGMWYLKRTIPNWEPCPDGGTAPGMQTYRFYPVNPNGQFDYKSTTFAGEDLTMSPSGSCGRNMPQVIRMPFSLQRLD